MTKSMTRRLAPIVLAVSLVVVAALSLVGCAAGKTAPWIGTYQPSSITAAGMTVTGSDLESALESMGGVDGNKLEILDDKNLRMTFNGEPISLPYSTNGTVLTCSDSSGSFDLVVDGNTVTWEVPESLAGAGSAFTIVFEKI
jgi:hypothetical protein